MKRSTNSLGTNHFYARLSRYAPVPFLSSSLLWSLTMLVMMSGPRLRKAGLCQFPLRQGLSTVYPRRTQRAAGANTDDLAAERKA